MEDSKIIELFFDRSEEAITELSKKYGQVCKSVILLLKNIMLILLKNETVFMTLLLTR